MKYNFSNYAHDNYESSETIEMLVEQGWTQGHAEQYIASYSPMYEVKADFEYDTETDTLKVLAAYVEGVKLVPEKQLGLRLWNTTTDPYDHKDLADNFEKIDRLQP